MLKSFVRVCSKTSCQCNHGCTGSALLAGHEIIHGGVGIGGANAHEKVSPSQNGEAPKKGLPLFSQ